MTILSHTRPHPTETASSNLQGLPEDGRMYAIVFDMDIESLRANYGDPYNNAYFEIRQILEAHGFNWQQGSTYFGGERINAVTCVLAAVDLARKLSGSPPPCATSACCASKSSMI